MRKRGLCLALAVILLCAGTVPGSAAGTFTDTRFQGGFTTENLDAIIEEYELYDGWYWTTEAGMAQTYHGWEGKPGWTDTTVNVREKQEYEKGWYGCRWDLDEIDPLWPNSFGWGECFGFAQFIGYLLSGDRTPSKTWLPFYSVKDAGGLKVGDLVRMEYRKKGRSYYHSAVVYQVEGDRVLFLQVSGGNFNQLRTRRGYTDGNLLDETSLAVISQMPGLKIVRCPQNQ